MPPLLLRTKLNIPPVRAGLVSRPNLIARLNAGLCRKLTLLSAPAGFGKTTLLSEWAGSLARSETCPRVAWISLDGGDNDLVRFLAYLIAALQTIEGGLGQGALSALQSPQPSPVEELLTALMNEISALPDRTALVLDDYHLITAEPVHDVLTFLLDHLPGNMHLTIASRADPPLPIARLRGRGQLTELRLTDLRFTPDQAGEFLVQVMGLEISSGDVVALSSRTEGWIAGLQMAALALQSMSSPQPFASPPGTASAGWRNGEQVASFIQAFTGSDRYILDYLVEEVFRRQSAAIQSFLLRTSILDRLTGPLCDALVQDLQMRESFADPTIPPLSNAQAVLEYLERANLFIVPLDNERRWYRYHRLFADLLRSRLGQVRPESVPVLHRRASSWYEQEGLVNEAIDHALAAEDLERGADLIEGNAEATLMRGQVATLLRWVEALPEELVRARPSLCAFHAWTLLLSGHPLDAIKSRLRDAEGGRGLVTGRITALRALMAAFEGQLSRAVELSRQALAQLSPEDRFMRDFTACVLSMIQLTGDDETAASQSMDEVLRISRDAGNVMVAVTVMCNRAELYMKQGQLHLAAATYREVLELATDSRGRRLPIAGQAFVGLGELSREWNDLDAADRYLAEGIRLTEQWTEVGPLEAYIALARVRQARGDLDGAWEAVRKAEDLAVRFDVTDLDDIVVAMFQARLWIAQGDLAAAQRWAERRGLYPYLVSAPQEENLASIDDRMRKYELLVLARLTIAQGRLDDALALLESLLPLAVRRGRPGLSIEIHVLQASALQARGDLDLALTALARALSLAEPEGYARLFLDEGPPMEDLLREALARGIAPEVAAKLLAGLESKVPGQDATEADLQPETLIEPLSERELEVLRLLSTHLSSTEIAEELCVSVNTARFHIKNIYGKMGVHRRSEAVDRARQLRLL